MSPSTISNRTVVGRIIDYVFFFISKTAFSLIKRADFEFEKYKEISRRFFLSGSNLHGKLIERDL